MTEAGAAEPGARAGGKGRVFWLGMHKVLVETEFRLLQDMGHEVFRPPYLSDVADQSVSTSPDFGNAVLSPFVHGRLSTYNFFYNEVASDVAELLNAHFDAVVVTINPDWLKAVLAVFRGTVIYRCYGQPDPLSASLGHNGSRRLIEQRDNFHVVVHAAECLEDEEPWLVERAEVVPYWLTSDVLEKRDAWRRSAGARRRSVALTCPNITNPYYRAHFRYLKRYFEERCFRYYGVQLVPNADFNVVGTLARSDQLQRMAEEAAFLYTYRERNVCYLPPIEMMLMGGPVLYLPGSLLDRYTGGAGPGRVLDEAEASSQAKRLIDGDTVLADEIVASQAYVARRYTPALGEPVFRATFESLLARREPEAAPAAAKAVPSAAVLVVAHFSGYVQRDGEYAAIHGIPRVMRQFVRALNDRGVPVVVTHGGDDSGLIVGFYASHCKTPRLVAGIDIAEVTAMPASTLSSRFAYAVVPHYHLFPEANALQLPLLAYIPDYLPHFFEGRGWFAETPEETESGRRLAATARRVLTNSRFSRSYLPQSRLAVPADRIVSFPLPYLGHARDPAGASTPPEIPGALVDEPYIFYPTQPHPNKRLDLLILAWLLVNRQRSAPVRLVLTSGNLDIALLDLIEASSMRPLLHLLPAISDSAVEWLYTHAKCLSFSSELEGNFPTQVLEALRLGCPVVCMDNPLIVSELDGLERFVQMAPFGDVAAFASRIGYCVEHRERALQRQRLVTDQILQNFSFERFSDHVAELHHTMISQEKSE